MGELFRYVTNGICATAIHYFVLNMNISFLGFVSAGLANGVAAIFGLTASFIGNRYFVFRGKGSAPYPSQAARFVMLYAAIALVQAGVMWLWADRLQLDYRIGFVCATALQFMLSFIGNKLLVFKK